MFILLNSNLVTGMAESLCMSKPALQTFKNVDDPVPLIQTTPKKEPDEDYRIPRACLLEENPLLCSAVPLVPAVVTKYECPIRKPLIESQMTYVVTSDLMNCGRKKCCLCRKTLGGRFKR